MLAVFLARRSISRKFARTYLGVIWISLEKLVYASCLVFLSTALLGGSVEDRATHVLSGLAAYSAVTSAIFKGMHGVVWDPTIQYSQIAFGTRILRQQLEVWYQFLQDLLVIFCLSVLLGTFKLVTVPLLAVSLAPIIFVAYLTSAILCPLFMRFRDIGPITETIFRVGFFATPIFWNDADLKVPWATIPLTQINPFALFVRVIRAPLELGQLANSEILWLLVATIPLLPLALWLLGVLVSRAGYWA